jgi:hypothetical protein
MRRLVGAVAVWTVALTASATHGEIHGEILGTSAPPTHVGGIEVAPFDPAPQEAIPDFDLVLEIPGGPTGPLPVNDLLQKLTVPTTFPSWSHGYTGPVFAKYLSGDGTEPGRLLTLPEGTRAFYLYIQVQLPEPGFEDVSVYCDGVQLSASVGSESGATGFACSTDDPSETLSLVAVHGWDFVLGELGIGGELVPVELQAFTVE